MHIAALHHKGSNNPLGINASADKINFYPYLVYKDRVGLLIFMVVFSGLIWFAPNVLAHPDNNIPANSLVTPLSIVPEWYFRAPTNIQTRLGHNIYPFYHAMSYGSKACPPHVTENGGVRSGGRSTVSGGGCHNKHVRATFSTAKLMNLTNSMTVIPWTFALLLLAGTEGYGTPPESGKFLDVVSLRIIPQMIMLQGPKLNTRGLERTLALPKGRKPYGKRAAVIVGVEADEGQQIDSRKERTLIIPERCEMLTYLRKNYKNEGSRLIHYRADVSTLILAYEIIKSRPGNMTPGATPETLDGIHSEYFLRISKSIWAGKYQFSPAWRVWIPKPGKTEKRPF